MVTTNDSGDTPSLRGRPRGDRPDRRRRRLRRRRRRRRGAGPGGRQRRLGRRHRRQQPASGRRSASTGSVGPVDRRRRGAIDLVYPDGPHDAESMFVDRQGRLYVITKALHRWRRLPRAAAGPSAIGHQPARAPSAGSPTTPPTRPCCRDGRHVLVRGYGSAERLHLPEVPAAAATFALPRAAAGGGDLGRSCRSGPGEQRGCRARRAADRLPPSVPSLPPRPSRSPTPHAEPDRQPDDGRRRRAALPDDAVGRLVGSVAGVVVAVIALGVLGLGLGRRRPRWRRLSR